MLPVASPSFHVRGLRIRVTNFMASRPTLLNRSILAQSLFLMVTGLYFLSELIVMDSFYFLVGPQRWISLHHNVTRVLISSIFVMCMRLKLNAPLPLFNISRTSHSRCFRWERTDV